MYVLRNHLYIIKSWMTLAVIHMNISVQTHLHTLLLEKESLISIVPVSHTKTDHAWDACESQLKKKKRKENWIQAT